MQVLRPRQQHHLRTRRRALELSDCLLVDAVEGEVVYLIGLHAGDVHEVLRVGKVRPHEVHFGSLLALIVDLVPVQTHLHALLILEEGRQSAAGLLLLLAICECGQVEGRVLEDLLGDSLVFVPTALALEVEQLLIVVEEVLHPLLAVLDVFMVGLCRLLKSKAALYDNFQVVFVLLRRLAALLREAGATAVGPEPPPLLLGGAHDLVIVHGRVVKSNLGRLFL